MKVEAITLHYRPGLTTLGGNKSITFTEGSAYPDLHYIVREGMHVVNYTDSQGRRHGVSVPTADIRQVNTVL